MLKVFMRRLVSKLLARRGTMVIAVTEKAKVAALIDSLHPQKTAFSLIRLGPNSDGGYLLPDCLAGIAACFSPGVANVSEFEQECSRRGMQVFMADKSVEKPNWNQCETSYDFIKKFIGNINNDEFMTLEQWVDNSGLDAESDLLLQMDIEGSEYGSLLSLSDSLQQRFRIMVIEFHYLHELWNPHLYRFAAPVFEKILQTHVCVHIHPNNYSGISHQFGVEIPNVAEFTFLRKDFAEFRGFADCFPHKLDVDNTSRSTVVLPENWFRKPARVPGKC